MSSTPTRGRVDSVMEAIVAYLAAHPAAADTADGIREVWLAGTATAPEVEAALERLVGAGAIVGRLLPDGQVLFAGTGGH